MGDLNREWLRFDSSDRIIFKKVYDKSILSWIEYNRFYKDSTTLNYAMTIKSIDNDSINKLVFVSNLSPDIEKQREYDYNKNLIRTRLFNKNFMTYQETYDVNQHTMYTMVWNKVSRLYDVSFEYSVFGYNMVYRKEKYNGII